MRSGFALLNTISYDVPDFPGDDPRSTVGQTFSRTGPARLVEVWKCPECGASVTKEKAA